MREDYKDEFGNDTGFRPAVENELAAWEHTGFRLGRGLVAAPIREEIIEGQYETTGWLFREIFVPAAKTERPAVQGAEQALPDLDEVEPAEEPQAA